MSKEDTIISMLDNLQSDMDAVKGEIASLKQKNIRDASMPAMSEREVFHQMSQLLTREEGDALVDFLQANNRRYGYEQ